LVAILVPDKKLEYFKYENLFLKDQNILVFHPDQYLGLITPHLATILNRVHFKVERVEEQLGPFLTFPLDVNVVLK